MNAFIKRCGVRPGLAGRTALLAACCAVVPAAARADAPVHMKYPVFGCEEARAARALNDRTDERQGDPRWVAYMMGDGQCVRITTQSPWAVIGVDVDGVTLVSYQGNVGKPGAFYVPTAAIDVAAPGSETAAPAPPPVQAPAGAASIPQPGPTTQAAPPPPPPTAQPVPPPATSDEQLAQLKADIAKDNPAPSSVFGPLLAFLFLVAAGGAGWLLIRRRRAARRAGLLEAIRSEIAFNTQALRAKRIETVQKDDFGSLNWDKWLEARAYYVRTRLMPLVAEAGFSALPAGMAEEIEAMIEAAATSTSRPSLREAQTDDGGFGGEGASPPTLDVRQAQ